CNVPFLILAVSDIFYFPFTLKRTTSDLTGMTVDLVDQLMSYLKGFWFVVPALLLLIASVEVMYRRGPQLKNIPGNIASQIALLLVTAGLWVLAARGGFQVKPLSPINAAAYASTQLSPAVTNTPFTFLFSLTKSKLPQRDYFTEQKAATLFNVNKNFSTNPSASLSTKPLNVVIIVLESFSREYLERFGNLHNLTPFLDSLYEIGYGCDNAFANGKHSNEGIPAVFASLPTLMDESFISSAYQQNEFNGIASLLKPLGYQTAFFHGAHNGTFNFDKFAQRAGFDRYYGKDEYPDQSDYDGQWGIWDAPYLQFVSNTLTQTKEPFCAGVFTLSSHYPFRLPTPYYAQFKNIGTHPLHPCIRYTDLALQKFFETASQQSWYNNTLFVVTSDHTSQADDPSYNTPLGTYRVPLVFYAPGYDSKGNLSRASMQVDVMPSVLEKLGYTGPFVSFGQSVFDSTAHSFAYQFRSGVYQACDDSVFVLFDGTNALAYYNYREDPLLKKPISTKPPEELINRLKAVVQQYNAAMNKNKLSVER
ncbi:MAG TPA: LTA synthase family protein, partial [Chitinophagales bacterium]|nr:LTA synthase family protein [Chitinophagales bacterium]